MVRIAWGGGSEKIWEGTIGVSQGAISQPRCLGIEADEPGSMWIDQGRLHVRQRSPRNYDGVDVVVTAPNDAKLQVQLTAVDDTQRGPPLEIPLAEIASDARNLPLDDRQNRLLVRRTPGDSLLVRTPHEHLVFAPGETLQLEIVPHLLAIPSGGSYQIKSELLTNPDQHLLWSETREVRGGKAETVPLKITLPDKEGVYDVAIAAEQNAGWPRALRPALHWKLAIA